MSSIRRLTYSITLSIVISAHSSLFYSQGGEFVAVPGIVLEGFFNVVIVEVTRDTFAGFVIRWMYFNFLFYTASIYLLSWVVQSVFNERREAAPGNPGPPTT